MKTTKQTEIELFGDPVTGEPSAEADALPDLGTELDMDEAIEAILFAAGHAVTYAQLANLFEVPVLEMKARVLEYAHRYNSAPLSRGVILLTYDEACQLCTKPVFLPYIRAALGIRKNGNLSASSIETLRQMNVGVYPYFTGDAAKRIGATLVTEADVLAAAERADKTICCQVGAIITPAARDALLTNDVIVHYEGEEVCS